ncbi:MAG: hypothetical protein ACHQ4J_02025, partial [Candidatus Binatia bacterium]
GYYYDYLAQRDHTQLVEDLARRFFGRALRVIVNAAEAKEAAADAPVAESAAALHAAAMGDPVVRAAVEIFGGAVTEVKSRTRRGKGSSE